LVVLSTNVGMFRGASKFTTWLFTIVKYECFRLYRKLRGRTELSETLADPAPLADEQFERSDLMEKVRLAIGKLEPDYREVFLLRDVEQQGTADVARQLGLSEAAVKSRLHRARLMVRTELLGPRS
jgi:RNA polymerase sigma-70 factor (ECF subfamily)